MNVTPNGKLTGFVAIEKPSTKFDDNGVYSCQLAFTGAAAKTMKAAIDEQIAISLKNGKNVKKAAPAPYTIEDKTLVVKFKQKARITSKAGEVFEKNVKVFDANNALVSEPLYMGEGSTVRVAYKPYLWAVSALGCGVTLQLEMVQVIDLVKRASASGSDNPFDAVEGFSAAKKNDNPFEEASTPAVHVEDEDSDF